MTFILAYYLAYYLLVYGINKLFYLQFGPPNLERLFETYGQSSPMRLMWTFMGASKTYTIFAGLSETIAGALLLFRRTRTIGALVSFGVMLNVFVLNLSYDVPVKLFSFQLMVIGLYLASLDWRRMASFFLLNQAVPAREFKPLIEAKKGIIALKIVQTIFILFLVFSQIHSGFQSQQTYGAKRAKSPLYGVYQVDSFIQNGDTIPPLTSDLYRWKTVLFDYPNYTSIILMNNRVKRYETEIDTLNKTIIFSRPNYPKSHQFTYELVNEVLTLKGKTDKYTLEIRLDYYDLNNFGLLNRGFNWVNEVPYNRYQYE